MHVVTLAITNQSYANTFIYYSLIQWQLRDYPGKKALGTGFIQVLGDKIQGLSINLFARTYKNL